MGKDIRFKKHNKEKSYGNLLSQKDYYSSMGYLPSYMKKGEKRFDGVKSQLKSINIEGIEM